MSNRWAATAAGISIATAILFLSLWRIRRNDAKPSEHDAAVTDPALLKKYSSFNSYYVPKTGFTYESIRVFYRSHPQAGKLPSKPRPLPLLVFIHGLGGSAAQFAPLLTSLVNVGPSLCIDLPGCGLSKFEPQSWEAYGSDALVQLLLVIIESYRDVANDQGVLCVGHSMGCGLAAKLISTASTDSGDLPASAVGLIALCPRVTAMTGNQTIKARRLLSIPTPLFDVWRRIDRRGGTESPSVRRFVGADGDTATKKLQVRFNEQSQTGVWRRMASGLLPKAAESEAVGGLPSESIWKGIDVPVFLIAGESDTITPPEEVERISGLLRDSWKDVVSVPEGDEEIVKTQLVKPTRSPLESSSKPAKVLKTTVLPSPASHSLLYDSGTCRTISGLIQTFLADHVDQRLSLGWQLQYLSTEGKWDVKNLKKWQGVVPVSESMDGIFRAMKTMREVDDEHCPRMFAQKWGDKIFAVIDISHESPVYDPAGLENSGIEYHKFPTVSKLPPSQEEVEAFNDLVDKVLQSPGRRSNDGNPREIGVHCHYGYNRTGFFIIAYLVARRGWRLQDAIEEFARRRPPGVRHEYFIDTLFVRFCVGLKRRPTLV